MPAFAARVGHLIMTAEQVEMPRPGLKRLGVLGMVLAVTIIPSRSSWSTLRRRRAQGLLSGVRNIPTARHTQTTI